MPQSHQLLNNVLDANQDLQMVWEQGLLGKNQLDLEMHKEQERLQWIQASAEWNDLT